MKVITSTY
jgi:hypothetical protein